MENKPNRTEYLNSVVACLDREAIDEIDFDKLKSALSVLTSELSARDDMAEETALLREHCQQRIAGMVKAMAALERRGDSYEQTLEYLEQLPSLKAEDLLKQYRRVSARFRDCFPASGNLTRFGTGESSRMKAPSRGWGNING